ncbi:MAG: hypothetical protein HC801_07240 [Nitrospira sp.]|nr:hypothetical protein [Nitrospira sp.]
MSSESAGYQSQITNFLALVFTLSIRILLFTSSHGACPKKYAVFVVQI